MSQCYICGRESTTACSKCFQRICRLHIAEDKETNERINATCTSCRKKQKLKRIQIIVVVICVVLMSLAIFGVVFSARNIFGG